MATLRLECVNSFSYPRNVSEDRSVRLYDKNNHQVPRGHYTYVNNYNYRNAIQEFGGGYSNDTRYVGLVFENPDLSFLDTSQIVSAKLVVTIAMSVSNDNFSFSFGMLDYRPDSLEFQEGYWEGITDLEDVWYGSGAIYDAFDDESGIFKIMNGGIESGTVIEADLTNSIDIVKKISTYGMGIYCRKVTACGAYGVLASPAQRPYIEIEYIGSEDPPTVTPLYPVSAVIDGDKPVTFRWGYSQPVNEPQSHFQIQKYEDDGWVDIVPKTAGSGNTYTAPAGTFAAGQASWRVMVWSQNGENPSEWSNAAYIIVQSSPKAPVITNATNTPKPFFTWQSADQQGYEITLGDYSTGIVYGLDKSWTYPDFLPDGNYTFSIRVQNQYGIWSPPSSTEITVKNTPSGTLTLSARVFNNGVSLVWAGAFNSYRIYRDGIAIAETEATEYIDYLSAGKHEYQVYAVLDSSGNYTPSNYVTEIVKPRCTVISAIDNINWIPLRLRNEGRPTQSVNLEAQVSFVHYQGRALPVPYNTGFQDLSSSFAFTFNRLEDYERLSALLGKVVIIKKRTGERVIGVLTGISSNNSKTYDFSMNIVDTDYREAVVDA